MGEVTVAVSADSSAGHGEAAGSLASALSGRPWIRRSHPFPHVVATDVFTAAVHASLEAELRLRLAAPAGAPLHFGRTLPRSGARALLFRPGLPGPFRLLLSRAWRDALAAAVGMRVTEHVSGAVHHHAVGDPAGFVHNDLNPGWFVHQPEPDGMVVADHTACRYRTGEPRRAGAVPVQRFRAVSVVLFLGNGPWSSGDGGETGLYGGEDAPVTRPAVAIPPVDNSLVAFACTPASFHAFMGNPRRARSSVAMWLHRTREDVVTQWGAPTATAAERGPAT